MKAQTVIFPSTNSMLFVVLHACTFGMYGSYYSYRLSKMLSRVPALAGASVTSHELPGVMMTLALGSILLTVRAQFASSTVIEVTHTLFCLSWYAVAIYWSVEIRRALLRLVGLDAKTARFSVVLTTLFPVFYINFKIRQLSFILCAREKTYAATV